MDYILLLKERCFHHVPAGLDKILVHVTIAPTGSVTKQETHFSCVHLVCRDLRLTSCVVISFECGGKF
jgi:hypothetical protein